MFQKNLGKKNLDSKVFGTKKCFGTKEFFGTQNIWVKKKFGYKKLSGPKDIQVKISLVKKKCWSMKIKAPKNWVPKVWSKSGH